MVESVQFIFITIQRKGKKERGYLRKVKSAGKGNQLGGKGLITGWCWINDYLIFFYSPGRRKKVQLQTGESAGNGNQQRGAAKGRSIGWSCWLTVLLFFIKRRNEGEKEESINECESASNGKEVSGKGVFSLPD